MKLYVVTYSGYEGIRNRIIKIFSTKENLDKWMICAEKMEGELYGIPTDPTNSLSKRYRVEEVELDNLDFVSLLAEARGLGAQAKPSQSQ